MQVIACASLLLGVGGLWAWIGFVSGELPGRGWPDDPTWISKARWISFAGFVLGFGVAILLYQMGLVR
jgi:hypothetical protein